MQEGNYVKMTKGKDKGRKAVIIDIDYMSLIGSYQDRYTIRIVKSGEEYDTISTNFVKA